MPGRKVGEGKRAVIYGRWSEPNEHERTSALDQIDACRRLASELGYGVEDTAILTDTGPNTTSVRPGLMKLLGLVADGAVQAVCVYTLDRLARPDSRLQEALLRELERREVSIYVARVPRGYHYDSNTGELVANPDEIAEANREDWRKPEFIIIPREDES